MGNSMDTASDSGCSAPTMARSQRDVKNRGREAVETYIPYRIPSQRHFDRVDTEMTWDRDTASSSS